ncbi:unnamed protein product [Leuciscus chuanchicus]
MIWLKAGTSNRQQTFIARYFFDAIQEHSGCPRFIRADRGKENLLVGHFTSGSLVIKDETPSEWGHRYTIRNCLQYTDLPLLERELDLEQTLWNNHDIRKQRNVPGPFGKPDLLFISPPEGFADMLCRVDDDLLQSAEQLVCGEDEPLLVANEAIPNNI